MEPKLINVGFGNILLASRVVAVLTPDAAPMKRLREEARRTHKLLDATHGRRTRAIIVTDSDHFSTLQAIKGLKRGRIYEPTQWLIIYYISTLRNRKDFCL